SLAVLLAGDLPRAWRYGATGQNRRPRVALRIRSAGLGSPTRRSSGSGQQARLDLPSLAGQHPRSLASAAFSTKSNSALRSAIGLTLATSDLQSIRPLSDSIVRHNPAERKMPQPVETPENSELTQRRRQ